MKLAQFRGYYFEEIVNHLLKKTKYIDVKEGTIPGRGANHQIDSYGIFSFTIPFVYPVRLLAETKWYHNTSIGLSKLRNFVGVLKDISENYFVPIDSEGNRNITDTLKDRYTDCGAYFSATDFTTPAQNYAYAHGIYLITFKLNQILSPVIIRADELINEIYNGMSNRKINRNQVSELFKEHVENDAILSNSLSNVNTYVGILDGVYPIIITSNKPFNFKNEFDDNLSTDSFDIQSATKEFRLESKETVLFHFNYQSNFFEFTLPTSISKNLIRAIETTYSNQPFSKIEIPIELLEDGRRYRRIFSLKLSLPNSNKVVEKIKSIDIQK